MTAPAPRSRRPWAGGVAALLLAAALLPLSASAEPKTRVVEIQGMQFVPARVVANPGDTLVWKNADLVPHNVVGATFQSGVLASGESFSWKVEGTGDLQYRCTLHPTMFGTIAVQQP